MKKILLTLLIVCYSIAGSINFVVAYENKNVCNACGASAPEFSWYNEFIKEALTIIRVPKENNTRRYHREILSVFKGVIDRLNITAQGTLTTILSTMLVPGEFLFKDIWEEIRVVTSSQAILRDYKKLLNIDTILADYIFSAGTDGIFFSKIQGREREQLEKLISKYSTTKKIFNTDFNISDNIKFGDYIGWLYELNRLMKKATVTNKFINLNSKQFKITISNEYMSNFENYYECARGFNNCSSSIKQFSQNISNTAGTFTKTAKNSLKTIKDSVAKLGKALSTRSVTEREKELLKTNHGYETNSLTQDGFGGRRKFGKMYNNAKQDIKENLDKTNELFNKVIITPERKESEKITIGTFTDRAQQTDLAVSMLNTFKYVNNQQLNETQDNILFQPTPITYLFPPLSNSIYVSVKALKGDIIDNFKNACYKQCSNKSKICE